MTVQQWDVCMGTRVVLVCKVLIYSPILFKLAIPKVSETCRGLRRETLRQAGDRTGPRPLGATTRYRYKG